MRRPALAALVGALILGAAPMARAADAAKSHAPGDPWERFNRWAYAVENKLDRTIIRPATRLFRTLSPGPIGQGVHNAMVNLSEPVVFFNDVLQLRFKRAADPAERFLANSTLGIFGLFDVAGQWGVHHHDNEFGVTMGRYGVKAGPYLYLPLVGPTTVRDLIGSGVDIVIDPFHWLGYTNRTELSVIRGVVNGLDMRAMSEAQLNAILADATDPYATLRSVFLQNKQGEIEGGGVPLESLPSFDDSSFSPPASAGTGPADGGAAASEATASDDVMTLSSAAASAAASDDSAPYEIDRARSPVEPSVSP